MNYLVITLLLIILSRVYIMIAQKYGILDIPNHRSSHRSVTIRGGGILFFLSQVCFFIESNFSYWPFFLGLTMLAVISFLDDIRTLKASIRFFIQFTAVSILLFYVDLDIAIFFTAILLVGAIAFLNAFNFMDGINGITGVYSIVVLLVFLYLNITKETFVLNEVITYALISVLIFGYYNFRKKALFFAGDVGSISMAFILLFLSLRFFEVYQSIVFIGFFAVYGADTLLTILKRIYLREKISKPHRHHIYQKLVDVFKWSHMKVAIVYGTLQLASSFLIVNMMDTAYNTQLLVLLFLLMIMVIIYVSVNAIAKNKIGV